MRVIGRHGVADVSSWQEVVMEQQEQDAQGPAIDRSPSRSAERSGGSVTTRRPPGWRCSSSSSRSSRPWSSVASLMWLVDRQRIPGPGGRVLVRPPDRHDGRLRRRRTQRPGRSGGGRRDHGPGLCVPGHRDRVDHLGLDRVASEGAAPSDGRQMRPSTGLTSRRSSNTS